MKLIQEVDVGAEEEDEGPLSQVSDKEEGAIELSLSERNASSKISYQIKNNIYEWWYGN